MTASLDTPAVVNIVTVKGSDLNRTVQWQAGDTNVDFAGTTVRGQVRKTRTLPMVSNVVLDLSSYLSVGEDTTEILLAVPASVTFGLPIGEWSYDLFVDWSETSSTCILAGKFTVSGTSTART